MSDGRILRRPPAPPARLARSVIWAFLSRRAKRRTGKPPLPNHKHLHDKLTNKIDDVEIFD